MTHGETPVVSLSNHEYEGSLNKRVLSETLILRQAQDERFVEESRTSDGW